MCIMAYLNDQERAALLEGGFAFQYWNGGVSALYTGADAVDFVEQHYSPINFTIANICFGNHPMIADAYDVVLGGEGYVSCGGTSDDIVSVVLDEMVLSFTPFV